jgi:hypothetical protein
MSEKMENNDGRTSKGINHGCMSNKSMMSYALHLAARRVLVAKNLATMPMIVLLTDTVAATPYNLTLL